jgi:hypothetical protein
MQAKMMLLNIFESWFAHIPKIINVSVFAKAAQQLLE